MPHSSRNRSRDTTSQINRRTLLGSGSAGLAAHLLSADQNPSAARGSDTLQEPPAKDKSLAAAQREYLRLRLYTREDLTAWLTGKGFPFSKYDPELGYLHIDRDFREGVDRSICSYRYDRSGARRTIAHNGQPCRINTYGNSFTSCEQVSDGETWQEFLAAHLGEPIRNYGIGGYSVYLAYLRMKREEKRSPARYIIFNIFDDDHSRNLLSWQRIRFGVNRKSTNPPIPHVKVNPDAKEFVECPNPCPTSDSLYELCDLDAACRMFEKDRLLNQYVLRQLRREHGAKDVPVNDAEDPAFMRSALYATKRIVEKVEEFAAQEKRRVLYVLSYNPRTIRRMLTDGSRFDQDLVDFLNQRRLPYVDLLKAHAADYAKFAPNIDAYLARYFIGHYNPLGNFFCAFAMKDQVVRMLQPAPPAYSRTAADF